jgi:amino acid permease
LNPEGETPMNSKTFDRMSFLLKSDNPLTHKSKGYQLYFNSVKIFLGNAYLTIPNVFKRTGWIGGIVLFVIVALLNCVSMSMVMTTASKKSTLSNKIASFSSLAQKVLGTKGKIVSDISVLLL